jgi:hypothetical protein
MYLTPEILLDAIAVRETYSVQEERCPFCGAPDCTPIPEHGHYAMSKCRQVLTGCCDGTQ